jgi:hypothetical protein
VQVERKVGTGGLQRLCRRERKPDKAGFQIALLIEGKQELVAVVLPLPLRGVALVYDEPLYVVDALVREYVLPRAPLARAEDLLAHESS